MHPLRYFSFTARTVMLLLFVSGFAACAGTFHVATNGNDAWSGTLAAPNTARTDGPFATLERARDEIRQQKKSRANETYSVLVHGGLYALPKTLQLEAQDSGTASAPIVWRAFENEKPVIIGGKAISRWKPWKGNILQADVGAQGFKGIYFRQLILDGKRQHLARYPNYDPQNPYGGGWAYADGKPVPMYGEVPGEDKKTLLFKASDARAWGAGVTNAEVFVFARYNWWNNIERVASIDGAKRVLTLARNCSYSIRPGDRYYVRNLLEELDAPGEWFLDKQQSVLYFFPPTPLAGKLVCAPTLRTILDLGPGTANVTFLGLTFECAEGTAVQLTKTTNCVMAGCTIRNVGDYNGSGIGINGGFRNGVEGCDIFETGSHGVHLGGGDQKQLIAAENYANNNYIHHVGVFYKQGVGISMNGCGNRATHNLIHDGPRMGIMFGGNNHIIELNEIRHVNLETEDTGAVYTGGRDWLGARGTVIRHNYFHDILGYGRDAEGKWRSPHFAWGVYLDDNTGGVDVIGNVVVRAHRAGIHLHNGRDNHIFNNLFIESVQQQMECNGWTESSRMWRDHLPTMIKGYESVNEPVWRGMRHMDLHPTNAPLPDGKIMASNVFLRNIVAWNDPKAKYVSFRTFPFDYNRCDSNLIWHAGQPILTGQTRVGRDISPNLLSEGGFEASEPGKFPKEWWWQSHPGNSAAVVTTEIAASGNRSFRIDGARTTDAKGNTQHPSVGGARVPAKPGAHYRLTAKLKASKPDAKVSLAGQSHIPNVYFWAQDTTLNVGTEWKSCEVTFKFPAPGDSNWKPQMTNVEVAIHFKEPDGALFVDDLSLTETEALNEWESWQALGMDQHSIIADPLFVNAAKDDYRLPPNSPAFKLGFEPIPFEKIGPYASAQRASWPIAQAEGAREKPLVNKDL